MNFLDFVNDLNYNLKETELEEERAFLESNKVQRIKEEVKDQEKEKIEEELS